MDTCLEPCVLREISKIAPVAEEKKVAVCERVTHVFMAVLKSEEPKTATLGKMRVWAGGPASGLG